MSKSTKIIAALGVVAGLGVAALPAFTFAAQTPQTVTGNADVYVEVQPAIAMTITGNNDDNITDADEDGGYGAAGTNAPVNVKNPNGATTIDGLDVSSFEVGTATKASSSYVSLLPNTAGNTKSVVSVYTNNSLGYDLAVKAVTSADMTMVEPAGGADTIAAIASTPTVGTAPGWAFKVATPTGKTNVGSINSDSEASPAYDYSTDSQMTTTDQHIVTSTTQTSNGDSWDVIYDVATKADQATGVYKVTLTYTATTNNS